MANSQLLDLVLIAMVAGVILFRLYSVLGRRTGNERPPPDSYRLPGSAIDPQRADGKRTDAKRTEGKLIEGRRLLLPFSPRPADPMAQALQDIKRADRTFDANQFIATARGAYEIISAAFASGDRAALRPLVSDEVYAAFDEAIASREQRHEKIAYRFVGFRQARIVHAALASYVAEITLSFDVQFTSTIQDEAGASVNEGAVRDVSDVWTFSRDVRSRDPNWTLVATSGDIA